MYNIKIYDKEIIFDDSTKDSAEELKRIIEKNKLLFMEALKNTKKISFIKKVKSDCYIENLDEYIKKVIEDNFYAKDITERLSNFEQCVLVYLGYLITEGLDKEVVKKIYKTDDDSKELIDSLGDSLYKKEFYEDVLVKLYFEEHGTKEDFIEFIKTKNNLEEIIPKIKNKYRFLAYNFVLDNLVKYLDECGYLYPENMLEICNNVFFEIREKALSNIIDDELNKKISSNMITEDVLKEKLSSNMIDDDELNDKLSKLSKLDEKKLNAYFVELLQEIDPDGILLKIYNDALKKGKIKISINYSTSCCIVNGDNVSLEIEKTGTVKDFFMLSHEFMHYVINLYNKNSIPMTLDEFPSIFFESYSIDFLKRKGYPKSDIETLKKFRFNDLQEKSFGILGAILPDLIDKTRGKEVDGSRLREFFNTLNEVCMKQNERLKQLLGPKEDGSDYFTIHNPDDYINDDIDYRTKSYFVGLIKYIEAFKYPISAYIAYTAYEKVPENKMIIEQVINFMLYANKPTFKGTIELFGISDKYVELLKSIEEKMNKVFFK